MRSESKKLATERWFAPPTNLSASDRPKYSNDEPDTSDGFLWHADNVGLGRSVLPLVIIVPYFNKLPTKYENDAPRQKNLTFLTF